MDRRETLLTVAVAIGIVFVIVVAVAVYDAAPRTLDVYETSPHAAPNVTVTGVTWSGDLLYNASCYGDLAGGTTGFTYPAGTNVTIYATLDYPLYHFPTPGCPDSNVTLTNVTSLTPGFKVVKDNLPITTATNATDVAHPAAPVVAVTIELPSFASVGPLQLNCTGK